MKFLSRMSRRSLLILGVTIVGLYFSLLVSILAPLHNSRRPMSHDLSLLTRRIALPNWCKGLRRRSSGPTVALASFPGSGNTWLRYLLQQATGIVTGSIYMDHALRNHGFPAENISDGSVLVVKTHEIPPADRNKFQAAVLLIRNPRDAILADFNRLHMGHLGTAPKTAFTKRNKTVKLDWIYYVSNQLHIWRNLNKLWLGYKVPVHVVHYENLVEDTKSTLYSVLSFLNETVTENEMECVLNNKEGIYRRKKKNSHFDPFTPSMYYELDNVKTYILNIVNEYKAKFNHTQNSLKSI